MKPSLVVHVPAEADAIALCDALADELEALLAGSPRRPLREVIADMNHVLDVLELHHDARAAARLGAIH